MIKPEDIERVIREDITAADIAEDHDDGGIQSGDEYTNSRRSAIDQYRNRLLWEIRKLEVM